MRLSILAALAACDGSPTKSNENGSPVQASSTEAMSHEMGPFFHAETEMNDRMMSAIGTSAGDAWVRKMIEHHRGAVEVSKILLEQISTGPPADMARTTVEKQTREIADLQKLLREGRSDYESAAMFQSPITQMHEAMMAVQGADAAETWMRKMLEHRRGGIAISDVLLHRQGVAAEIRRKAVQTRSDQQKDIQMLQRMLRGQKMNMRQAAPPTPNRSPVSKQPVPSPAWSAPASKTGPGASSGPAKTATSKLPQPGPPATVDPHAGHDMGTMSGN